MPYLDSMKETGSNTITPAEWRSRIEDRLSARVVHPQIPVRSEDGLETYLVNYYSDADPSEKLKIEEAVLDIEHLLIPRDSARFLTQHTGTEQPPRKGGSTRFLIAKRVGSLIANGRNFVEHVG